MARRDNRPYGLAAMGENTLTKSIELNVDGKTHVIDADPDMPLLYALRDDLGLNNPKFGCGLGQCGACSVIADGEVVRSCSASVDEFVGKKITTLAGLGTPDKPHKVQAAFLEEQVPFCGYCLNGWMMTSVVLLEKNPHPSDTQIREAFDGLICRCGTHAGVVRAVKRAATA